MGLALRVVRPIGKRGQVVIPKDIRDHLHLHASGEVAFEIRDGRVEIVSTDEGDFLAEFLSVPRLSRLSPTVDELKGQMEVEHEEVY